MDKLELYNQAKDAYYNGEPIMTDLQFDELEKELGLENKGYVGTHHQKSYTVKHPYIMGSLSKVQIKESEDHTIDWKSYTKQIFSYLDKSYKGNEYNDWYYESTPKFDGCSFEVVFSRTGELQSVSTRGDGEYGKSIIPWFENEWNDNFVPNLNNFTAQFKNVACFIVRGECLVKKSVFNEKYSNDFTMPRSFVAGVLGQDWEGTDKQKSMRNDLCWMCYDYRVFYMNGNLEELAYCDYKYRPGNIRFTKTYNRYRSFDPNIKVIENIYHDYEEFRTRYDFALDGFVLKPAVKFRLQDGDRTRQEDCVAVKFLPEIVEATLSDIEWNVGKSGEYYPTGILDTVILGGKNVNRVSLANYGKIVKDNIGIGSKLKISLAGDIIPFVYKVVTNSTLVPLPKDAYIMEGIHLMKMMTQEDIDFNKLLTSVNVIKPDGIGEKVAKKLFDIWPFDNILWYMMDGKLADDLDDSKSSQNILKSLEERKKTLTLPDIIQSLGYPNCGENNAKWLARKISGLNPDTKGIPTSIIKLSENTDFREQVGLFRHELNVNLLVEEVSNKIPVILTGSPKNCGYNTKNDFLTAHPEYVETTKWNECKILFTDDLNSTSSKMEKAKKNNVEIKQYV